jgi:hypothetical protein
VHEADWVRREDHDLRAERVRCLEERIAAEVHELARRANGGRAGGPDGVRYLFVMGCPRSGTTAFTTLLNADERIVLGQERFRKIRKIVEPFHFREEIFFNPTEHETSWATPVRRERVHPGSFEEYGALRDRWRSGGVRVLGDKAPYYFRQLERLGRVFSDARFVLLVRDLRDVARSYRVRAADAADPWPPENDHRVALRDWTDAIGHARAFSERSPDRLLVVDHARFFTAPAELDRVYGFLGLTPTSAMRGHHAETVRDGARRLASKSVLPPDVEACLDAGRDHELHAWATAAATR